MAVAVFKTWIAGEVLDASDLNSSFTQIVNNGMDLWSPATKAADFDGQELTLDADADTSITADTDDRIDFEIGGTDSVRWGHDATTNTTSFFLFDPLAFTAQANTSVGRFRINATNALTVPAGTTAIAAGLWIAEPNFTATGTITAAVSLYIAGAPTEGGTSNYALWVDAGTTQLDGALNVGGAVTLTGGAMLWNDSANIASDTTTDLSTATGNYVHITGTTTITGLGTVAAGALFVLVFDGALILTHNGTSLILPGAANITTVAGDTLIVQSEGSGNWRAIDFMRTSKLPLLQGKHTIFVPAAAMKPSVTSGCASLASTETTAGRPDMITLDFDASGDEHAQFAVAFPDSWDEGTITFRAYWTTAGAVSTGVAVCLQGVAAANDDTIDVAYGTTQLIRDNGTGTAEDLMVTAESSALTIAGSPAAGELCFFDVYRDVSDSNDDMTQDMRLIGVQIFYLLAAGNDA